MPNQTVILGLALELSVIPDKGSRPAVVFKGGEDTPLLSDADGDALCIVRPSSAERYSPRAASSSAKSTWKRWSGFQVDGALVLKVPDAPLRHYLGRAASIVYLSDKWTGKAVSYEHKFESDVFQVWADRERDPNAIMICAFPPRHMVTARGIVG